MSLHSIQPGFFKFHIILLNASGYRHAYLSATSGDYAQSIITSAGNFVFPQSGSASIKCVVGDTVSLAVYQSTGGALNIQPSGIFQVRFSIVKIQ